MQEDDVTPGLSKLEYKTRRQNFMKAISEHDTTKDHIVVIPSAPEQFVSYDIRYTYRQNSNFLYLCGFKEPDSVLVLLKNSSSEEESVLFVRKQDSHSTKWEANRAGPLGALQLTGVESSDVTDNFIQYMSEKRRSLSDASTVTWVLPPNVHTPFSSQSAKALNWIRTNLLQAPATSGQNVRNASNVIEHVRLLKTEAEIELMRRSNQVTCQAMTETMRFSRAGVNEAHVWAKMEFECRLRGAQNLAYIPVVAGNHVIL